MNTNKHYFTKQELILWISSIILILFSFLFFKSNNYLTLIASIIGVTSLIFNAKGNPIGQILMIIFSIIYGIISFKYKYYGEMLTYLGMTAPMALFCLITWLKHPYNGKKCEVAVNTITKKEIITMIFLTMIITLIFYFILTYFKTTNIIPSTISVSTSFIAVYLTFKRSPYYAIGYAANDIILIWLWCLATKDNISYLSVVICFLVFFVNDLYGFINWQKMHTKQKKGVE